MYLHNFSISYNQVTICSVAYNQDRQEWDKGNIEQGMIYYPDYITFDPILDGSFGAWMGIEVADQFVADPNAQRIIEVPFTIVDLSELVIFSPFHYLHLKTRPARLSAEDEQRFGRYYTEEPLPLTAGRYALLYQVCEGKIAEDKPHEVYYRFSFCRNKPLENKVWKADEWGLSAGQAIRQGKF